MPVFWGVAPCTLVDVEAVSSSTTSVSIYTAQHPIRKPSSYSSPRETQISPWKYENYPEECKLQCLKKERSVGNTGFQKVEIHLSLKFGTLRGPDEDLCAGEAQSVL
jgi:hypothetical protein